MMANLDKIYQSTSCTVASNERVKEEEYSSHLVTLRGEGAVRSQLRKPDTFPTTIVSCSSDQTFSVQSKKI